MRSRAATSSPDYDLVVFPGHEEYVTEHAYDVDHAVPRPRRQPCVPRGEQHLLAGARRRDSDDARWRSGATRTAGGARSSAVQYVGSNHGALQRPYTVTGAAGARGRSPAPGLHERIDLRALRDRDRRAQARLAAGDDRARAHSGPARARAGRRR